MARDYFTPGTGPQGLHLGLSLTVQAPALHGDGATAISDSAPIQPGQPLRWGRVSEASGAASTVGLGRQAASLKGSGLTVPNVGLLPELIAIERANRPYQPIGVRVLKPAPALGDTGGGRFVDKIPYVGTPATGTDLAITADPTTGLAAIVAAASGVGRVVSYAAGEAEVLF